MEGFESLFETDASAEASGKWVQIGNAEYLLARAGGANTRYAKEMAAVLRPHQRRIQLGQMTPEEGAKLAVGPFVNTVLLNWRMKNPADKADDAQPVEGSLFDKAGNAVLYSKAKAKEVLLKFQDLFAALQEQSSNIANYTPEDAEADAGN